MATGLNAIKTVIEALETPAQTAALHFFTDPPGFGIRITPTGKRTFFFQYRWAGKTRKPSLGRYGDITPKQAQKLAREYVGKLSRGEDPQAERAAAEARSLREAAEKQWTLAAAIDSYLAERKLKDSTRYDMGRAFKGIEDWKRRPVQDITPAMVKERHKKLSASSEARANLAMRYLRAVLNHVMHEAQAEGFTLLDANPVDTLSHRKAWNTIKRRRTFIPPHKLGTWLDAVSTLDEMPDYAPGTGRHHQKLKNGAMQRDFLLLVLLTGLRLNEAKGLRWDDVDMEGRTLTIRDSKNHDDHTLPVGDYLAALLKRRRDESGAEYVFSSKAGHRLHNLRYALARIEEHTGMHATCHDLRRTFATIAESMGLSAYAIKQALNHRTSASDVTAGYVQVTPERLRDPMQRIETFILSHGHPQRGAKVVQLRG
ncbi:tyrosine-type recombinase/integrase [Vreelandella neptunia]|uniref:Tyrosine-type recombinase/integrase n=1 Tax=Vreelandella neptunia TaxID=115551 RepID=A0ABZ0YHL5_9GAMM|nr:tyrosine-type recombinase/integrase [Halomonas neptunia]MDN3559806.1 tyrosine-type recombinase/integrase [Halomonas neptunia]WQH11421.1 tyrosine-type recombinase/integrase [Halomonas neptunia]